MCGGLEESAAKCTEHLQLGSHVIEVHVLKILINKEEFLVKYCESFCVHYLLSNISSCTLFTELCEIIRLILFTVMFMH